MMKKIVQGLVIILFLAVLFHTCKRSFRESTKSFEVELVTDEKIDCNGGDFFLKISTSGVWRIDKPTTDDWYSLSSTVGKGPKTVILKVSPNDDVERIGKFAIYVDTEKQTIEFAQKEFTQNEIGEEVIDVNEYYNPTKDSYRIEVPRLSKDFVTDKAAFVVHYTEDNVGETTLNYSLEYNYAAQHTRWVAFTFYDKTSERNTKRSNAWSTDPYLLEYTDNAYDYRGSGFDRGHLVASADRLYSIPANEQTFYYSNMSPQIHSFNGGIWASLEGKVQEWGALSAIRDTLYVAKGGTIAHHQVMDKTIGDNKIVIPKHYFMALLAKKGPIYKSIAFMFEHKSYGSGYNMGDYAISVEELEKETGIDFFHNLPDSIECVVEKQKNLADWPDL